MPAVGRGGEGGMGAVSNGGGSGGGGGGGGGPAVGKSAAPSTGGGGKSGESGVCWPGCHFGLVLTAGGDNGALGLSERPVAGVAAAAIPPPGNWLASCLTSDIGAALALGGLDRLCCLGSVGGG